MTTHKTARLTVILSFFGLFELYFPSLGDAAEVFGTLCETTVFNSNVYSDASEEWDVIVQTNGSLSVDFADIYSVGYDGFLEVYPRHADLLFHTHELYFFANPAFGKDARSELVAELSIKTHRNDDAYAAVNLVEPGLYLALVFNPTAWLTLSLSETATYRWFYDDTAADGIDSWTGGEITLTAPSRTTIIPRVVFGQRYYPRITDPAASDPLDQQIEAGLRVAQNLFEGVGIRVDYAYIHGFGTSATVVRNLDEAAFQYLGEAFLTSAHRVETGLKFLFDNGIGIDTALRFADKHFNGWPARDAVGDPIGETRHDRELVPMIELSYAHVPDDDASPAAPELDITLTYDFKRNWSNDTWYDVDRHRAMLGLALKW